MLTLVDHNYKFLAIGVGSYGKEGNVGIFARSPLGKNISNAMKFPSPRPLPEHSFTLRSVDRLGFQADNYTDETVSS